LEEEPKQAMVRFLKGLDQNITKKVDLSPYWSFEDVCKLGKIKIHTQIPNLI